MKTKLTLTNEEVWNMDLALSILGNVKSDPVLSMAVARNRQALKPFVQQLEAAQEMDADMTEFNEKRNKLIQQFGKLFTLTDGKQAYQVQEEKQADYDLHLKPLKEEYAQAIEKYETQLKSYQNKILPAKANEGKPIGLQMLPKEFPEGVGGNLIFALIDLIPPDKK